MSVLYYTIVIIIPKNGCMYSQYGTAIYKYNHTQIQTNTNTHGRTDEQTHTYTHTHTHTYTYIYLHPPLCIFFLSLG